MQVPILSHRCGTKLQNLKNGIWNYKLQMLFTYSTESSSVLPSDLQHTCRMSTAAAVQTWWPTQKTGLVWKCRSYMLCVCVCVGWGGIISSWCWQLVYVYGRCNVQATGLPTRCSTFASGRDKKIPQWQKSTLQASRNSMRWIDH